ncbi:uncharacterized protein LOC111261068 isoform X1 [Varroa jacobsoni]|uniref:uncharacterized protein LOC111261068 isoform X1 n=1 Tax=Varroa jacobsoni TaxID=62625 RepID=UPI000BF4A508|nr:uncharacterized protein LOC111261068 isoform X1 [Varroa jacobsoni]XP_022690024.1 uncharacterized protein LOC111261068 isoform X1 [Varroa jacobsoni]XP_022690025.1 uncharacterized protein LOC111261068 isoform X1 [Varroa jacobsoni]
MSSARENSRSIPRPSRMLAQGGARPKTSIAAFLPSRGASSSGCGSGESGPSSLGSDVGVGEGDGSELVLGGRVLVDGNLVGVLRYLGLIPGTAGTWCGVELDNPSGKNDGEKNGRRYFRCAPNHGMFVPLAKVTSLSPSSPVSGRGAFGASSLRPPPSSLSSSMSSSMMSSSASSGYGGSALPSQGTMTNQRSYSKELRIEDYLESKSKAKESKKGSLQKFNEHASPKTLQRSLVLRNQFRDEPCPSEEEEEEDYVGVVPVVEPLISLKDRKQITASLSFGLQKLVQRQAPVRSKSEDNCTVKENAMSMPHRIVSLEDAEVAQVTAAAGTSGTASSNNDSSLSPIPEKDDDPTTTTTQEKTSNLLEPGPASQDASLSPIQELQDENEEGTSTCGGLRTSEMKDTRLISNSYSADDVAELPEEESGDKISRGSNAAEVRISQVSVGMPEIVGDVDPDCEEGPLVPEEIRISDNVFDIIMSSLRENFLHDVPSSEDPSSASLERDSKMGQTGQAGNRPYSADTGFQGDCDIGCDLGGGASSSTGDAVMKQSVCSQDSGVVCDTTGPSSLQSRSASLQPSEVLVVEPDDDRVGQPHGSSGPVDPNATDANVDGGPCADDCDLSEAAGCLSTSEATETATGDDESAAERRTHVRPLASAPEHAATAACSAGTLSPAIYSRSAKGAATPLRKPNVNVGSKIKAMLQENKDSTPVERKARPQRKNKWDEVEKKIQQNLQEKKKAKTEVKSRINSNLAAARAEARRSPRGSVCGPSGRTAEPSLCGEPLGTIPGGSRDPNNQDDADVGGPSRPESRASRVVPLPIKPGPPKRDYSRPWADPPPKMAEKSSPTLASAPCKGSSVARQRLSLKLGPPGTPKSSQGDIRTPVGKAGTRSRLGKDSLNSPAREEFDAEIRRLGALCEARTKELNRVRLELRGTAYALSALAIAFQRWDLKLERMDTYAHQLGEDLTLSEEALKVANQEIERLKQDAQEEVAAIRRELEQTREEHSLKNQQMEEEYVTRMQRISAEQQARIDRMKEQFAKMSADEVASRSEEMAKILDGHARELADNRSTYERELRNRTQLHHQREADLENALKERSEEYARVKREAEEFQRSVLQSTDSKIAWLRERNESLMKEVDSLNAVLEIRREEIDRLRIFEIEHGQLKDKLARSDDAIEKYKARIEDLSAMIGQKLAVQDQLAQENAKLKELAEHKDRMISTLGRDRDVLLYRLKENKDANSGQQSNCASAADRAMSTSFIVDASSGRPSREVRSASSRHRGSVNYQMRTKVDTNAVMSQSWHTATGPDLGLQGHGPTSVGATRGGNTAHGALNGRDHPRRPSRAASAHSTEDVNRNVEMDDCRANENNDRMTTSMYH